MLSSHRLLWCPGDGEGEGEAVRRTYRPLLRASEGWFSLAFVVEKFLVAQGVWVCRLSLGGS